MINDILILYEVVNNNTSKLSKLTHKKLGRNDKQLRFLE